METVNISMAIVNATSIRSRIQTTHVMFLSRKLIIDREERKRKRRQYGCVSICIYIFSLNQQQRKVEIQSRPPV